MNIKGHGFNRMMTGQGMVISFFTDDTETAENFFQGNLPDELEIDIHKKKEKRSLNANAYAWVLMDKIAASLRTTSIDVYKEIIQRVGVFDYVLVPKDTYDRVMINWARNGEGWLAKMVAERPNGIVLKMYYGSSTYDKEQMSRLIDEIVSEAKELGIETMTPDQLLEMKEKWGVNA